MQHSLVLKGPKIVLRHFRSIIPATPLGRAGRRKIVKTIVVTVLDGLFGFFSGGRLVRQVGPDHQPLERHEFQSLPESYVSNFGGGPY